MTEQTVAELVESNLEIASLSGEVRSVMQGIVDRLAELPGADGASLSVIEGERAYFQACAGMDEELRGKTMNLSDTLGAHVLRTGDVVVLRSLEGEGVEGSLTPGAGSVVLAPIDYDDRTRGIVGVRSVDRTAFRDDEVELVRLLARSAAVALRNAELTERLSESERRYRDQHIQAADAVLVTNGEGQVLDANDATAALLWYSVDELRGLNVASLHATDEPERDAARTRELQERGELRAERGFRRKDGAVLDIEYSCRLLDDGRVHATMRDVTQRKRNDNRLRRSLEQLHAIVQTQQEISRLELDPDAVTVAITERAQHLADADGAILQWFEGDESVYRFASGIGAKHIGVRLKLDTSLAGAAARKGETLYAADTRTDPRVNSEVCELIGARSLICAPLRDDEGVVGVLTVVARRPGAFDALAVETTRLMAQFVSSVFKNSAELESRRLLAEELRRQGQVVEHMQTALWICVKEGSNLRLQYANEASERATGLRAEEVVGKSLAEIAPNSGRELVESLLFVAASGTPLDLGEIDYGDARIAPGVFSVKAFPLPGDRVAVSFDNVTDMVRARRALQESEGRFRGAFDASSVGIALGTLGSGAFIQVNEQLASMLGYSVDELMKVGVNGIKHPEEVELDQRYHDEMKVGARTSYRREKRYLRKDGSAVWADVSVSLVRTYEGAPAHTVAVVLDITEQKEANLLFEAVFASSLVPNLIADDERRIVDLNQSAADLLGMTIEEALMTRLDEVLADEPVSKLWESFMNAGRWESEATLVRPDGGKRRIEFVATANVRPGRHIAVIRDLTRQQELESQLRQAQKMEAVGRLAGGIAHDFNNLLTAITGYSEFLTAGLTDDRLGRHAEEIKKAAARAAALTGQLLAFSRRQVLQPRVLDLNGVVSDMDMMLRRLIGEDVDLVVMLDPTLSNVKADPTQIEQVIVNLAVNARDAMPNGGSVTIETSNIEIDEAGFVELRMSDTGVGMTDEERAQLFDPFFTTKEGGTGLGLATVYGIVEQSGGTIEVDSAPGMGSSFRIWLPRVDSVTEEPPPRPVHTQPELGSETVLLVEDEQVVRELVAEILETTGYTVLQAGDGPSALELLRRHADQVHLLVTDVVMPGMSGPEVAQAVTAMRPGTHVLYTSGYTDSQIGHHGVLEPGIAFLQKPFSAVELTSKVRSLLDVAVVE